MLKIKNVFLIVFAIGLMASSCEKPVLRTGSDSDEDRYYIIRRNGNVVNNYIETEYDKFLITPFDVNSGSYTSRRIFLGGIKYGDGDYYVSIKTDQSWDFDQYYHSISPFDFFYYGSSSIMGKQIDLNVSDCPFPPSDDYVSYPAQAVIGKYDGFEFASYGYVKNFELCLARDEARDFRVKVFQQQGYEFWKPGFEEDLKTAFKKANINFIFDGVETFQPIPGKKWNYETGEPLPVNTSLYKYAYTLTDPGLSNGLAHAKQETNALGYLFIVPNASTDDVWATGPGNTYHSGDFPALSFIQCDNIIPEETDEYFDQYIKYLGFHELVHQYAHQITDSPHIKWHNGDDQSKCAIHPTIEWQSGGHEPKAISKKQLDYLCLCKGHVQRIMNISPKLFIYSPLGEPARYLQNSSLIESNVNVHLSLDRDAYFEGQRMEPLIEIINNTDSDTLFGNYKGMLINKTTGKEFPDISLHGRSGTYLTTVKGKDTQFTALWLYGGARACNRVTPPFSIPAGEYEFYLYKGKPENKITESINFRINEPPEEMREAFAMLSSEVNTTEKIGNITAWWKMLYEKYQGTIYDYEYSSLVIDMTYLDLLRIGDEKYKQEAKEFIESFFRKYSNSQSAIGYYIKFKSNEEKYKIYKELTKEIEQIARTKDADKLSYGRNILLEEIEDYKRSEK